MPTITQLIRKQRVKKSVKSKAPALAASPQKRGVCKRVYTTTPRKPNTVSDIFASLNVSLTVMNVFVTSVVRVIMYRNTVFFWLKGGGVKDLPGVKYHIVRGALDCSGVKDRKQARSKYGAARPKA